MTVLKLPLSVDLDDPYWLMGADGQVAIGLDIHEEPATTEQIDDPDYECWPNTRPIAAEIARAVNAYESLVAALEAVHKHMFTQLESDTPDDECLFCGFSDWHGEDCPGEMTINALKLARDES